MSKIIALKGIVLRTTNYSETSIICDIYTDVLGTRGYIVSGVRTNSPTKSKGVFFQPAALLDLLVYHHDHKNLNRIKEFKWDVLYSQVYFSIFRNAIALFVVELLSRTLKHPDQNLTLFDFAKKILIATDTEEKTIYANLPLYFMTKLIAFLGYHISESQEYMSNANHSVDDWLLINSLNHIQHISELAHIKLNRQKRNDLFYLLQDYYKEHIPDFGTIKSYRVMREIF